MAERALILSYAPASARDGVAALLTLDDRLGAVLRGARDPLLAQLRLTWWYDALAALDTAAPLDEPTLQALAADVLPAVSGAALARQVDGWEALLATPLDRAALLLHAAERGGRLFAALGAVLGAHEPRLQRAGEGWALADLARHLPGTALTEEARALAQERLAGLFTAPWPTPARSTGALALLARMDLDRPDRPAGHPARVARLLVHRLTGR